MSGFLILITIIVGTVIFWNDSVAKTRERTRTEGGNPKLEMQVIQFDNVPQGAGASIVCRDNSLDISTSAYEKVIQHEDIISMDLEYADNVADNPNFSVGKAVAGMLLLGGVGAVAGISGSNKERPKMLIVSYREHDKVRYMMFLQQYGENSINKELALVIVMHGEMLKIIGI